MSRAIVRQETLDQALVLTIDREAFGNALSAETAAAISDAIKPLASGADDLVRCVILTGAGNKFFCAGGDIKRYRTLQTAPQLEAVFSGPRRLMNALEDLPIPVIAAVNGYALGGGAELMLAGDLRVAEETAQIGFPQTRLNIIPGWHGVQRLARDIGHARAMKLLLTGERLTAATALELGLIHAVVEPGKALQTALQWARSFESCGPLALGGAKRVLHSVSRRSDKESRAIADAVLTELWLSEDHREAEAAFEEKRQPVFKGR